ncbi:hypothetical protein FQZ97_924560 [compost metagenome]
MQHEDLEQGELAMGQVAGRAVAVQQFAGGDVEGPVAEQTTFVAQAVGAQRARHAGAGRAAQQGADARDEFAVVEGLGDEVVDSGFEAQHAIGRRALAGEDDDRNARMRAQLAREFDAVFLLQPQIDDHEREGALVEPDRHGQAVRHGLCAKAGGFQQIDQRLADLGIVVDHEDFGFHYIKHENSKRLGVAPGHSEFLQTYEYQLILNGDV